MRTLRLLCDTNPMCYGSSASLLAILDHVEAETTALVRDVTAEILGKDPAVDHTIAVDNKSVDQVRRAIDVGDFDAALVISNRTNLLLYLDAGLPVFFVDVLFWFGQAKAHPVWERAEATFLQVFPGVEERWKGSHFKKPPLIVGPLIRQAPRSNPHREGTLAQIGGARSVFIRPGENSNFPLLVVEWLHRLESRLPKPITLAAGRDAIAVARTHPAARRFRLVTLPNDEFARELAKARCFVTTPGQGAVFEGLLADADLVFLPPQNATQVAQLRHFENAGLVQEGLNLPELDPAFEVRDLDRYEHRLTEAVLASLKRIDDEPTCQRIVNHLQQQLESVGERRHQRKRFSDRMGHPGGPAVASGITTWRAKQQHPKG